MTRRPRPPVCCCPRWRCCALALGAPAASLAGEATQHDDAPRRPTPQPPTADSRAGDHEAPRDRRRTPTVDRAQPPEARAAGAGAARAGHERERLRRPAPSAAQAKRRQRRAAASAAGGRPTGGGVRAKQSAAPAPSTLTPALPLDAALLDRRRASSFFIESFQIPPFLLPIFQAAGTAYGIPWQVLAAINEVETDYGRDLSVSSAGAEGWMQFLPSEWAQYGVDANGDGFEGPVQPGRRDLRGGAGTCARPAATRTSRPRSSPTTTRRPTSNR